MKRLWGRLLLFGLKPLKTAPPEFRDWLAGAAGKSRRARLLWPLVALVGWLLPSLGVILLVARRAYYDDYGDPPDSWAEALGHTWEGVLAGEWSDHLWFLAPTVLILIPLRLIWLRRAAVRTLGARGRCAFCGHGLSGVPLNAGDVPAVTCPECGKSTPAVEAWNESGRAPDGRLCFSPATNILPILWTKPRLRRAALATLIVVGTPLAVWGGSLAWREIGIRREAAIARSERLDVEAFNAEHASRFPPRTPGRPLVEDLASELHTRTRALESQFKAALADTNAERPIEPDVAYIGRPQGSSTDEQEAENYEASLRLMTFLREAGLFAEMDAITAADARWESEYTPPDSAGAAGAGPRLSPMTSMLRICRARVILAVDAQDPVELRAALRTAGCVIRALGGARTFLEGMVAWTGVELLCEPIHRLCDSAPTPELLDAAEEWLESLPSPEPQEALRTSKATALDIAAWFFSDPERARKGAGSREFEESYGMYSALVYSVSGSGAESTEERAFGTYIQNRDFIAAEYDRCIRDAALEPFERQRAASPEPSSAASSLFGWYTTSSLSGVLRQFDSATARRRGALVRIALERFRMAHGQYPESLTELPPETRGIVDPYSGKPLGYRRLDAGDTQSRRRILLWSVGVDGEDQSGREPPARENPFLPEGPGFDLILNPEPPAPAPPP